MGEAVQSKDNAYGCIYKIRNVVDGMVYVGQTKCAVSRRWTEHKRDSKNEKIRARAHSFLHNAMFKHGADTFEVCVLDTGASRKELNEKESYWIQELNSLSPNGYNIRTGGWDSTFTEDTLAKIGRISRERWAIPGHKEMMAKISKEINQDPVVRHKHRVNSTKMWENPDYRLRHADSMKAVVKQKKSVWEERKNLTGKSFTEEHCRKISTSKAGKTINKTEDDIRKCSERFIRLNKERHADRWFAVFDFYGTIVGKFNSFETCAEYLGVGSDQVSEWARGEHISSNYRFALLDKETGKIGELVGGPIERIRVTSLEGEFLGDFKSKADCEKTLKVARKTIGACVLGLKTHKKYTFRLVKNIGINQAIKL